MSKKPPDLVSHEALIQLRDARRRERHPMSLIQQTVEDNAFGFWQARYRFAQSPKGQGSYQIWQQKKEQEQHLDNRYRQAQRHTLAMSYEYDYHRLRLLDAELAFYGAWWRHERHPGAQERLVAIEERYRQELVVVQERIQLTEQQISNEGSVAYESFPTLHDPREHHPHLLALEQKIVQALETIQQF